MSPRRVCLMCNKAIVLGAPAVAVHRDSTGRDFGYRGPLDGEVHFACLDDALHHGFVMKAPPPRETRS